MSSGRMGIWIMMVTVDSPKRIAFTAGTILVVVFMLYISSFQNYLLFHSLIEMTTIVIAFAMLSLTWNTSRFLQSGYLKIIGIGYGLNALLDLFHTLAYKGMGVFPGLSANFSTQFWIAARFLQAVLLVMAPFYARRNVDERIFFCIAAIVTLSTITLIQLGVFPDCFMEKNGLTQFKILSEYVISTLMLTALILFSRVRAAFDAKVFALIAVSIACSVCSELAFTSYLSVYDQANMIGHFLKLAAFAFIYQAVVVTGMRNPYDLVFRDLKQAEQALGNNQLQLEELVHERTAALEISNSSLASEIGKHKEAREKLFRLNRELHAIRNCTQVLVHAQDEQALLGEICRIVCDEAGYRMAWVGYAENDEAKTVRPVAFSGSDNDYLSVARISWDADSEYGHGQTGQSIRSGLTGFFQDIATDPIAKPWRKIALQRGFRSSISLPLKDEMGFTFGAFMLYSSEPHAFTDDEIRLLEELASDMAFGITTLRLRAKNIQSETQYRTIIQTALDGFLVMDTCGRILEANISYCSMTGYTYGELHGMGLADIEAAQSPEETERKIAQIIQHGGARFESRHRCKDGSTVELDISITYSPGDAGGRFFAFTRDITDLKHNEQLLKEHEERFRNAMEVTNDGLWEIDVVTDSIYWSPNYYQMLGYEPSEFPPSVQTWEALMHPEDRQRARKEFSEGIDKDKDYFSVEFRMQAKDGAYKWILGRGKVFGRDRQGRAKRIIGVHSDITEQKLAVEALRHSEEQLRQSQKMEAIGQLAGGVAHDFNNILQVIGGYCSLLQTDDSLSEPQLKKVDAIASSADKAAQLTRGLLAFSRKQSLVTRHESLNEIIQHVHNFLARIIGEDITLTISSAGTDLPIIADRGQLEQVLVNLAANARDAMPNGGVFSIKSELAVLDASFTDYHKYDIPAGKYALLTVSDTGTGISKEHLDHIFEPFFTTKEVGKGTGLGMAISYGIIKQHNGFINVYSEPGQGTVFRIYLPIREADRQPLAPKADTVLPAGGDETILVAEDDPTVRNLVSEVLSIYGYDIIPAVDGLDAVDKFKVNQDRIGLILMDMIMPKKNGKEAYEEIQKIKPGIKVLFSSGYTADFIQSRGVSEEGIELLMKPVQPTELLKKVRHMLDA